MEITLDVILWTAVIVCNTVVLVCNIHIIRQSKQEKIDEDKAMKELENAKSETSAVSLSQLQKHPHSIIRAVAAGNKNVSSETLWRFVHDPSPLVRVYAACNEVLTEDMRKVLTDDGDPNVRKAALRTNSYQSSKAAAL